MKLLRRFKWDDRTTVYLPVLDDDLSRTDSGMVRFVAVSTDGTRYSGAAYDTTVSSMVDARPYWKLVANPKKPEKSYVEQVAGVPLADSAKSKRRASEKDAKIDGQGD